MQRRSVIKLLAAGGIVGASAAAFKGLTSSNLFNNRQALVSKTKMGMGTYVTITVTDASSDRAEEGMAKAFERMGSLEALLTRFESSSPVSFLNSGGRVANPPRELVQTLELAGKIHQMTSGLFDVTIAPMLSLYERSFAKGAEPTAAQLKEIMPLVGSRHLMVTPAAVYFDRSGMSVSLDGIAKGYIVDAMAETLKNSGIKHALINAGGDIRAFGGKYLNKPWKIAVRNPADAANPARTFDLFEGACATSGNYEIYYDREKLFHHIIDPATGYSPRQFASATVVSDTTALADALSTSLMLMGRAGFGRIGTQAKDMMLIDMQGHLVRA